MVTFSVSGDTYDEAVAALRDLADRLAPPKVDQQQTLLRLTGRVRSDPPRVSDDTLRERIARAEAEVARMRLDGIPSKDDHRRRLQVQLATDRATLRKREAWRALETTGS